MQTLPVDLSARSYPIHIGEQLLKNRELLVRHVRAKQVYIVTNDTIAPLYLPALIELLDGYQVDTTVLPDGESFKNLETLNQIFDGQLEARHNIEGRAERIQIEQLWTCRAEETGRPQQ